MRRICPVLLVIAIVAASIVLFAFPPRQKMRRAVEDFGFHDVHVTGFAFIGCPQHDGFSQKWTGRTADGKPVNGVVCGGLLEGWTVRLT